MFMLPPMFILAFMPPPIPIFVFIPIPPISTFMLVFIPTPPILTFVFMPMPPILAFICILGAPISTFMFMPGPQLRVVVVTWQDPPTGCIQTGGGEVLLMMIVWPNPVPLLPAERSRLHSITDLGAQQMLPQQRQFPPSPSQAQMWQHQGSIILRSSGLQHHQEQMRLASWQPPQQTPQQLYHQQSQMRHWHMIQLILTC